MSEPAPIVFVVDDDRAIREGLRRLLTTVGLTVAVFPNAQTFLDARRSGVAGCLVLDVRLPGLSGLDLQARLVQAGAMMPIVFLTGHGDIPMSVRAMKAGAVEFLTKPFRPQDLVDAIMQALERDRVTRSDRLELEQHRSRYEALTTREREVLAGVVAGLRNKDIASAFGTSEFTVKEQRAQMLLKMQVDSVPQLVRIATRLGLRAFEDPSKPPPSQGTLT